ncbi:MAG: lytic transglycosylase domain-containing protein [Desulfovibrionaceae bacterium]|nr:lytic transglycosylase domain-containing protein [Desulfovibrionaceae bacterium]
MCGCSSKKPKEALPSVHKTIAELAIAIGKLDFTNLKVPPLVPPDDLDDQYGGDKYGPRILWHASSFLYIAPKLYQVTHDNKTHTYSISKEKQIATARSALTHHNQAKTLFSAEAYLREIGITDIYALSKHAKALVRPKVVVTFQERDLNLPSSRAGLTRDEWQRLIIKASQRFGLDPKFIAAVIQTESGFDPKAVSPKGAQGIMQIMPATQAELGLKDPFDLEANLFAGCALLRTLLAKYDSVELALAAYNAGVGAVKKYGGIPPFKETTNYVRKVLELWGRP